jgi:Fic family protein
MDKKLRFDFRTTQQVIKAIGFIDSFKGEWRALEKEEGRYLKELKRLATIQSIGSSTRIEGATLTNEEIETLLKNLNIHKLQSRDEQEVIGYYEGLEIILEQYEDLDLSEGNIFNLHNQLLKYSSKDQHHKGRYKQLSNKVVATYPGGEQNVIFNTTEPYLVGKEMSDLLSWTKGEFEKGEIHPLIVIGTFVYEFLSIHPFQDGNGRLSRLLTTLLLLRHGYDFIQYISFENQIEQDKQAYYKALMDARQHRYSENEMIDAWMLFFQGSLQALIQKLEEKYSRYKSKGPYLNDRQKQVLAFIESHAPVRMGDIAAFFTGISRNTLKKDVQYLVQEGVIEKMGEGKGTAYVFLQPPHLSAK